MKDAYTEIRQRAAAARFEGEEVVSIPLSLIRKFLKEFNSLLEEKNVALSRYMGAIEKINKIVDVTQPPSEDKVTDTTTERRFGRWYHR